MNRLAAVLAVAPTAALAHPGDHRASALWHLLTEPDHLAMIAVVMAGLGYAVYKLWSRS
jgi:hypothetical protein